MNEGRQFGSFTILSLIGKGGMGEVYRARDGKLGREVAVKVLPASFALDPDRVDRFDREARLLAALNHPNIATIHGLEESDGQKLLILELVEGETLAERVKRGPIPVEEALEFALQIAEALEAAHEKGVVHRDLKPANIKITPEGRVKVLDFGLAKAFVGEGGEVDLSQSPTVSLEATQKGLLLGTAAYMSPEQARGQDVDRRADIWAFGCVLYEMLTGSSAFGGGTITDSLAKVLEGRPDFDKLPRDTPPLVRRLIHRCLDKNARERLQHIGDARVEVRDALAEPVATVGSALPVAARSRRRTLVWAAAAVALAILAALAGSLVTLRSVPARTAEVARLSIGPFQVPGVELSGSRDVAVSPDGNYVAYVSFGSQIWLKRMDQAEAIPLASGGQPFFSPDSEWVAFFGPGGLNRVSVNGGAPIRIAPLSGTGEAGRVIGGTWGADGTIVFAASVGLFRISAGETDGEATIVIEASNGEVYGWPHFLPDGESLLFTIVSDTAEGSEIARLDLTTLTSQTIQRGGVGAQFLREGYLIYADEVGLKAVAFNPDDGQVQGTPVSIPGVDVQPEGSYHAADFAVSETGTLAHIPPNAPPLSWPVWVDHDGAEEIVSGAPTGLVMYPRVSPDGNHLGLDVDPADAGRRIWVLDLERGFPTRVSGGVSADGAFEDLLPQWSRDGSRIYFGSNRSGAFQVYSVASDGSGSEELLIDHPDVNMPYRTTDDGRLWFYSGGSGRPADVGLLNLVDSSGPERILDGPSGETNAVLSPDGTSFAYQSNEEGSQVEIYLRPFPNVNDGRIKVSDNGGVHPLWDASGSELYYRNPDGDMMAVAVATPPEFAASTPRTLFSNNNYRVGGAWSYDISPIDGRFIMTQSGEAPGTGEATIQVTLNWIEELRDLLPLP